MQSIELPVPKVELPPAPVLPAPPEAPAVVQKVVPQPPSLTPARTQPAAPAPEPVTAPAAKEQAAPQAVVQPARPARIRRHGHSASAGTGGAVARAASVGHASNARRPAVHRAARPAALGAGSHAAAPAHNFTLVPVADTVPSGGGAPDLHPFALSPLGAPGADILATVLLIGGGALLIALMVLDAAGLGPRRGYLLRRGGQWRLPWR